METIRRLRPSNPLVFCSLQRALWYCREHTPAPPPPDFKLATLCQYFDVPFSAASAHEALGDVLATLGLYRALVANSKQTLPSKRLPRQAA